MRGLIRSFAQANRRACRRLDELFPHFFVYERDDHGAEFRRMLHSRVETGKVGSVIEVGGIDRPVSSRGGYEYIGLGV